MGAKAVSQFECRASRLGIPLQERITRESRAFVRICANGRGVTINAGCRLQSNMIMTGEMSHKILVSQLHRTKRTAAIPRGEGTFYKSGSGATISASTYPVTGDTIHPIINGKREIVGVFYPGKPDIQLVSETVTQSREEVCVDHNVLMIEALRPDGKVFGFAVRWINGMTMPKKLEDIVPSSILLERRPDWIVADMWPICPIDELTRGGTHNHWQLYAGERPTNRFVHLPLESEYIFPLVGNGRIIGSVRGDKWSVFDSSYFSDFPNVRVNRERIIVPVFDSKGYELGHKLVSLECLKDPLSFHQRRSRPEKD